jgi:predicted GTPase
MTLRHKQWIIAALGGIFLLSLVFVQAMEVARRKEEAGLAEHAVATPANSKQCVDCHVQENPGIVAHWRGSTHARKGVGCVECHLADEGDADAFDHKGVIIATVVTPRDYARIVERAQGDADLILWDGGNNDFPFVRPDLHVVLVDPLRPGHETSHHPGEAVLRMADIVVVAKVDAAADADVQRVVEAVRSVNPTAALVRGASPVRLDDPEAVRDRRVLVVEDGPSITHGGMAYGAGTVAATRARAAEIVDPRAFAVPEIASIYADYPHIGHVLPAVGYGADQLEALRATIERADVDVVVAATPIDLTAVIEVGKPVVRARYDFADIDEPGLETLVAQFLARAGLGG